MTFFLQRLAGFMVSKVSKDSLRDPSRRCWLTIPAYPYIVREVVSFSQYVKQTCFANVQDNMLLLTNSIRIKKKSSRSSWRASPAYFFSYDLCLLLSVYFPNLDINISRQFLIKVRFKWILRKILHDPLGSSWRDIPAYLRLISMHHRCIRHVKMTYHVKFHSSIILARGPNDQNALVHQKNTTTITFQG